MYLKSSKDETKACALLQALKLRLLKTQKGKSRKQMMQWFITYDILGCSNIKDDLLEKLLKHPSKKFLFFAYKTHRVVEYCLVLLNIMAAYGQGVDYLISRDMNVRLLLELLYTEVPLFIFLFQACEKLISQWIHF
jgi:hypothetical protein